jgi:hypothetical protein
MLSANKDRQMKACPQVFPQICPNKRFRYNQKALQFSGANGGSEYLGMPAWAPEAFTRLQEIHVNSLVSMAQVSFEG